MGMVYSVQILAEILRMRVLVLKIHRCNLKQQTNKTRHPKDSRVFLWFFDVLDLDEVPEWLKGSVCKTDCVAHRGFESHLHLYWVSS